MPVVDSADSSSRTSTLAPILIVEDMEADRYLAYKTLSSSFVNPILQAKSGYEALDYFKQAAQGQQAALPCVVLLDVRLPGMSGQQLLEWVSTVPAFADVVFGVLTNYPFDLTLYSHKQKIPVFSKPINQTAIENWVRGDPRIESTPSSSGKKILSLSRLAHPAAKPTGSAEEDQLKEVRRMIDENQRSLTRLKGVLSKLKESQAETQRQMDAQADTQRQKKP
jgi:CheY-like chemotaxis protein